MRTLLRCCAVGCAFLFTLALRAQTSPALPNTTAQTLIDSLNFRAGLVAGIITQEETAAAALARLHAKDSASGLSLAAAADFAFAAIDVGQRLVAAGKPAEAELFFQDAETSLDTLVQQTPDASAQDKALYLRKLSLIRGRYLNKIAQAKTDLEQAIVLQPEDRELQRAKAALARGHAEYFKDESGH